MKKSKIILCAFAAAFSLIVSSCGNLNDDYSKIPSHPSTEYSEGDNENKSGSSYNPYSENQPESECTVYYVDEIGGNEIESKKISYGSKLTSTYLPVLNDTSEYEFKYWTYYGSEVTADTIPVYSDITLTSYYEKILTDVEVFPASKTSAISISVTITAPSSAKKILYTTNGENPAIGDENTTEVESTTASFTVSNTTTLKVTYIKADGTTLGNIVERVYTIDSSYVENSDPDITVSPASGRYEDNVKFTIKYTGNKTVKSIIYTDDGTEPSSYNGTYCDGDTKFERSVFSSATYKVKFVFTDGTYSGTATGEYEIYSYQDYMCFIYPEPYLVSDGDCNFQFTEVDDVVLSKKDTVSRNYDKDYVFIGYSETQGDTENLITGWNAGDKKENVYLYANYKKCTLAIEAEENNGAITVKWTNPAYEYSKYELYFNHTLAATYSSATDIAAGTVNTKEFYINKFNNSTIDIILTGVIDENRSNSVESSVKMNYANITCGLPSKIITTTDDSGTTGMIPGLIKSSNPVTWYKSSDLENWETITDAKTEETIADGYYMTYLPVTVGSSEETTYYYFSFTNSKSVTAKSNVCTFEVVNPSDSSTGFELKDNDKVNAKALNAKYVYYPKELLTEMLPESYAFAASASDANTYKSSLSFSSTGLGVYDSSLESGFSNFTTFKNASMINDENVTNHYPAFDYCNGLEVCGKSNWYLPSRDELINLMFNVKKIHFAMFNFKSISAANNSSADEAASKRLTNCTLLSSSYACYGNTAISGTNNEHLFWIVTISEDGSLSGNGSQAVDLCPITTSCYVLPFSN